jgi:hypothetical protein
MSSQEAGPVVHVVNGNEQDIGLRIWAIRDHRLIQTHKYSSDSTTKNQQTVFHNVFPEKKACTEKSRSTSIEYRNQKCWCIPATQMPYWSLAFG